MNMRAYSTNKIISKSLEDSINLIKPEISNLVKKIKETTYLGVKSDLMNKIGDVYREMYLSTNHGYFKEKTFHSYCAARNFANK